MAAGVLGVHVHVLLEPSGRFAVGVRRGARRCGLRLRLRLGLRPPELQFVVAVRPGAQPPADLPAAALRPPDVLANHVPPPRGRRPRRRLGLELAKDRVQLRAKQ